jgi:polyadenylate-binding protein
MKAQFTNLYVKNVDLEMPQEEFHQLFAQFGTVTSALIQIDENGASKGFGFVNYENHEAAQAAVDNLHDTEHYGKKLFVSRAQKKAEREEELRRSYEQAKMEKLSKYQGVNLYIKNLEDDFDDDKLRAEFEAFGTVTSCKVMRNENGTSKGFGFVCFSAPDEATKAVAEMNNKMIGSKPLYVSLAQRREVRRQQLESQIAQRNQIRMQQAAAAGLPAAYINGPAMYYAAGPGPFPPQARGAMLGYGQPGMLPPRPRYGPTTGVQGIPIPAPYGQPPPPPQAYAGMPGYPRGAPRAPPVPRVPGVPGSGTSPTMPSVPMPMPNPAGVPMPVPLPPRANGPPAANGVPAPRVQGMPAAPAPPAGQMRAPPVGGIPVPVPAARGPVPAPAVPQQGYKMNSQTRVPALNGQLPLGQQGQAPVPEGPTLTAAALANASPMEQKQMLGEVIYMRIVP